MSETPIATTDAGGDDEEWRRDDDCTSHFRLSINDDLNNITTIRIDGGQEVYLGPDEAEAAGRALLDCARNARERQARRGRGPYKAATLELEWHSGPPPAPRES